MKKELVGFEQRRDMTCYIKKDSWCKYRVGSWEDREEMLSELSGLA